MTGEPRDQPDRLVFLSHSDYVRLKDKHPHLLSDTRVVAVPFPLVGRWTADEAVRGLDVTPGAVFLRDRETREYLPADTALRTLALSQVYTFIEVCQLLGAVSLDTVEYSSSVRHTKVDNHLTGSLTATAGAASSSRSATADVHADLREQVRSHIRSSSRFTGGAPDVEAARAKAAESDDVTRALRTLITMRSRPANGARKLSVQVDFLSEAHRQVDVLLDFAHLLSAALGATAAASLEARLSNQFQWATDTNRHQSFSVEVTFPDTGLPAAPDGP